MAAGRAVDLKTKLLTIFVVLTNVLGNFSMSWGMKHQATELGLAPLAYIRLIFSPWVMVGISLLILWLLSRMALLSWADLSYVLPVTSLGYVASAVIGRFFLGEQIAFCRVQRGCLVGTEADQGEPAKHAAFAIFR